MISISVNLLFAAVFCSIENDGIVYELFRNILNTMCVTVFMNGFILLGRRRPGCLSSHLLSMLVGLQKLEIPKVCTKCHVRCHTLNSNNTISFGGVTVEAFNLSGAVSTGSLRLCSGLCYVKEVFSSGTMLIA